MRKIDDLLWSSSQPEIEPGLRCPSLPRAICDGHSPFFSLWRHTVHIPGIDHRRAPVCAGAITPAQPSALANCPHRIGKNAGLGAVRQCAPSSSNHHQQERYPALIPAVLTALHTIELIGSYVARHVESGLTVDLTSRRNRSTTKGPISPLCRKLVALGHDPNGKVHVIRKALDRDGHIPVFQHDRTLETWAGRDCVESEARSARVQKYRPYPDAVEASQRG
jgi:hypothetical protein